MPFDRELVLQKLAALGNTPEAVAASLEGLGVRGTPGDCYHCPLANYIRNVCELPPPLTEDGDDALLVDGFAIFYGPVDTSVAVKTPPACREFTQAFDELDFPALIDPDRPIETYRPVEESHAV